MLQQLVTKLCIANKTCVHTTPRPANTIRAVACQWHAAWWHPIASATKKSIVNLLLSEKFNVSGWSRQMYKLSLICVFFPGFFSSDHINWKLLSKPEDQTAIRSFFQSTDRCFQAEEIGQSLGISDRMAALIRRLMNRRCCTKKDSPWYTLVIVWLNMFFYFFHFFPLDNKTVILFFLGCFFSWIW